jgi:hypothetical protein
MAVVVYGVCFINTLKTRGVLAEKVLLVHQSSMYLVLDERNCGACAQKPADVLQY